MSGRIIRTQDDLAEGIAYLAGVDPVMRPHLETLAPLPLRLKPEGFGQLLSAIIGQQVSVASAAAIWRKMTEAGLDQPDAVVAAREDDLRAVGLSRQKVRYAKALAAADIDYAALRDMPDAQVIKALTAVTGIGLWTAEIYLKFSLGRADAFAAGDLAIQIAAQALYDLPQRPSEKALRQMAEPWAPWRSVAARLLWSYYHELKQRDGIR